MAFENIPTPPQMANNWYDLSTGRCLDCTEADRAQPAYQKMFLPMQAMVKDVPAIDGVPQVRYVNAFAAAGFPDNLTLAACYDRANQLALDNPAWAKKVGQDGLIKVAVVCMWEAEGRIPSGYMQQLVTALAEKSATVPAWVWLGGAAVAALLLLRR